MFGSNSRFVVAACAAATGQHSVQHSPAIAGVWLACKAVAATEDWLVDNSKSWERVNWLKDDAVECETEVKSRYEFVRPFENTPTSRAKSLCGGGLNIEL